MLFIGILGVALAGVSSAQSTVSLFLPGFDPMPLVASIVASDSKATTYAVQCAPGTDGSDCGMGGGVLLTQGPATAALTTSQVTISGGSTVTLFAGGFDCSLAGTTSAVCVSGYTGVEANDPGPKTTAFAETDITFQTATLGSVSLYWTGSASPASTALPAVSKTDGSTSNTQKTGATAPQTNLESGAQQTNSAKVSSTSTGGVPMVTGHGWVVGGAAAFAVAML